MSHWVGSTSERCSDLLAVKFFSGDRTVSLTMSRRDVNALSRGLRVLLRTGGRGGTLLTALGIVVRKSKRRGR